MSTTFFCASFIQPESRNSLAKKILKKSLSRLNLLLPVKKYQLPQNDAEAPGKDGRSQPSIVGSDSASSAASRCAHQLTSKADFRTPALFIAAKHFVGQKNACPHFHTINSVTVTRGILYKQCKNIFSSKSVAEALKLIQCVY